MRNLNEFVERDGIKSFVTYAYAEKKLAAYRGAIEDMKASTAIIQRASDGRFVAVVINPTWAVGSLARAGIVCWG